jgi:hypothetical protein
MGGTFTGGDRPNHYGAGCALDAPAMPCTFRSALIEWPIRMGMSCPLSSSNLPKAMLE